MRIILISTLCLLLSFEQVAFAQLSVSGLMGSRGGSEFYVGKDEGKPLITVNLVGGVSSPGVYHIPIDTTLAQLIAYAGGASTNANLDEVSIRRQKNKEQIEILQIDFKKLATSSGAMPVLSDKDIVDIPVSYFLEKASLVTAIVSAALGIVLATRAITRSD